MVKWETYLESMPRWKRELQINAFFQIKGGRMGRSDKVSLWCVSLLINTRFRFFILE